MSVQKVTGKASYINFNSLRINITKASPKIDRVCANTTDGADFDVPSGLIQPSQLPVSAQMTLDIEMNFDLNLTSSAFIAAAYSTGGPFATVLGINASAVVGHGLFDLTNFAMDTPIADTVTATATLLQNGVFTVGS